jgi:hypothetical protein
VKRMGESRSVLFDGRHVRDEIIALCVRRYLRYLLGYREAEEMMARARTDRGSLDYRSLGTAVHRLCFPGAGAVLRQRPPRTR